MNVGFYPAYLRRQFTNRMRELSLLQSVADDLAAGTPRRVAIWGLRRVGKTLLIQEQVSRLLTQGRVQPVYMDLEDICTSPEMFAQRYVGWTAFWALTAIEGEVDDFLTVDRLLETAASRSAVLARTAASLLRSFAGQPIPGELLGLEGTVSLPTFRRVAAYRSPDGQIEVDALAEAEDGNRWIVEVKWRGKRAGCREIEKLAQRAADLSAKAWLISQGGFTSQARSCAQQAGVMISTAEDLARLAKQVRTGDTNP